MKQLEDYIRACMRDLDALGIPYGKVCRWEVNTRAVSRWGACKYAGGGTFVISIAQVLLEDGAKDQALKDTIVHELLHTVPGCFDHRGNWKRYADRVNSHFPQYAIKRTASRKEKDIGELSYPYVIKCCACGAEFPRMRKSKLVRFPERYRCGSCHGRLMRIV